VVSVIDQSNQGIVIDKIIAPTMEKAAQTA